MAMSGLLQLQRFTAWHIDTTRDMKSPAATAGTNPTAGTTVVFLDVTANKDQCTPAGYLEINNTSVTTMQVSFDNGENWWTITNGTQKRFEGEFFFIAVKTASGSAQFEATAGRARVR